MNAQALLVLEDGQFFVGQSFGAAGESFGELVFNTSMTGYQEILTDPSYYKQIVVMTAPHIGNTGMNAEDQESGRIWASGLVVREPARRASNWRAERTLRDDMDDHQLVGITGIDTRALTRVLRDAGVMRAGIFPGGDVTDLDALVQRVRASEPMAGANLSHEVTTAEPYRVEVPPGVATRAHVVAVDLGIKAMTPELMASRGIAVTVVPSSITIAQIKQLQPDGVFFSNGPGDPGAATGVVELLREVLDASIPYFGICFGSQILGRALGFGTYKLPFGHRGANQPVKDLATGKVEITTHNHGFAVDIPVGAAVSAPEARFGSVRVSHVNLNDNVVEGIECLDIPAFAVQYHPEAAAGPHDASYLFDRFVTLMEAASNATP